jgi:hypothetical protein
MARLYSFLGVVALIGLSMLFVPNAPLVLQAARSVPYLLAAPVLATAATVLVLALFFGGLSRLSYLSAFASFVRVQVAAFRLHLSARSPLPVKM